MDVLEADLGRFEGHGKRSLSGPQRLERLGDDGHAEFVAAGIGPHDAATSRLTYLVVSNCPERALSRRSS